MLQMITMNLSDWIKAAALVTQYKQEAATADTDQLSSIPLSQLAMNDSGAPVVHYGTHMPTATSTPTRKEVHMHSPQQEDSYQQIIPGIPQGSLYPTLSSLSSEAITSPEEAQTLHDKVSKGLEKYLQDAEQCHALEVNYFDDNTRCTREEPKLEDAEQTIQSSKDNKIPPTQTFIADINVARNAPESLKSDTGHTRLVCTDADDKHQIMTSEDIEPDTNAHHCDGKHPVEDITRETTPTQSEQLCTLPTSMDKISMPVIDLLGKMTKSSSKVIYPILPQ